VRDLGSVEGPYDKRPAGGGGPNHVSGDRLDSGAGGGGGGGAGAGGYTGLQWKGLVRDSRSKLHMKIMHTIAFTAA